MKKIATLIAVCFLFVLISAPFAMAEEKFIVTDAALSIIAGSTVNVTEAGGVVTATINCDIIVGGVTHSGFTITATDGLANLIVDDYAGDKLINALLVDLDVTLGGGLITVIAVNYI